MRKKGFRARSPSTSSSLFRTHLLAQIKQRQIMRFIFHCGETLSKGSRDIEFQENHSFPVGTWWNGARLRLDLTCSLESSPHKMLRFDPIFSRSNFPELSIRRYFILFRFAADVLKPHILYSNETHIFEKAYKFH